MYEYKFVKATLGGIFKEANHQQIINQNAKEGWKLANILPVEYNVNGKPTAFEIIFERKMDN